MKGEEFGRMMLVQSKTCLMTLFSPCKRILKLEGLISCLVDNLFWDESKSIEICVIDILNKSFVTSQEELKYVGLNIEQGQRCIYLDQQMHTGKLKKLT